MFYESPSRLLLVFGDTYTSESFLVLKIFMLIVIFLSMLASLYISLIYICYPKTRNFAFKMVFYLNIADFCYALAQLLVIRHPNFLMDVELSDYVCMAQSFLITWFGLASIVWTSIIAWTLYSTVILNNINIEENEMRYIFMGFILPMIAAVLPFFTNDYGSNGIWCWFTNKYGQSKQTILEITFLYMELWLALIFNAVVFYKVISVLKYMVVTSDGSWIRKLRFYPFILIICWVWGSVFEIMRLVDPSFEDRHLSWLIFLSCLFSSLQGIFNAFIYGFNASVIKIFRGHFCCLEDPSNQTSKGSQKGTIEMDSMDKGNNRDSLSSTWSYDPRESIGDLPQHDKTNVMMKDISSYVFET